MKRVRRAETSQGKRVFLYNWANLGVQGVQQWTQVYVNAALALKQLTEMCVCTHAYVNMYRLHTLHSCSMFLCFVWHANRVVCACARLVCSADPWGKLCVYMNACMNSVSLLLVFFWKLLHKHSLAPNIKQGRARPQQQTEWVGVQRNKEHKKCHRLKFGGFFWSFFSFHLKFRQM